PGIGRQRGGQTIGEIDLVGVAVADVLAYRLGAGADLVIGNRVTPREARQPAAGSVLQVGQPARPLEQSEPEQREVRVRSYRESRIEGGYRFVRDKALRVVSILLHGGSDFAQQRLDFLETARDQQAARRIEEQPLPG